MTDQVKRLNDQSMEWLVLIARTYAVVAALDVVVFVTGFAWTGEPRWLWVALILAVSGGAAGWFGWWHYGNDAWRAQYRIEQVCGATYRGLTCSTVGSHIEHWDQRRDPSGQRRWS